MLLDKNTDTKLNIDYYPRMPNTFQVVIIFECLHCHDGFRGQNIRNRLLAEMKNCYHISTVNLSQSCDQKQEARARECLIVIAADCVDCTSRVTPYRFVLPPTTNGPFKKSSASS
jgi:hypothetical protein